MKNGKKSFGAFRKSLCSGNMSCGEGMSGRKKSGKDVSIVRSSAAEYLTFIAACGTGGIDAVYADENIWLTQKMMGVLYDLDVRTNQGHPT
jgi:hypothetical protein